MASNSKVDLFDQIANHYGVSNPGNKFMLDCPHRRHTNDPKVSVWRINESPFGAFDCKSTCDWDDVRKAFEREGIQVFEPRRDDDAPGDWMRTKFPPRGSDGVVFTDVQVRFVGDCGWRDCKRRNLRKHKHSWIEPKGAPGGIDGVPVLMMGEPAEGEPWYVVEGAKAARHLVAAGHGAVCWIGGAGGAGKVDWSPMRGKRGVLIADNNKVGMRGMRTAARNIALADGEVVGFVDVARHFKRGADIADFDVGEVDGILARPLVKELRIVDDEYAGAQWVDDAISVGFEPRYNEDSQALEVNENGAGEWLEASDSDIAELTARIIGKRIREGNAKSKAIVELAGLAARRLISVSPEVERLNHVADEYSDKRRCCPLFDSNGAQCDYRDILRTVFDLSGNDETVATFASEILYLARIERTFRPGAKQDVLAVLVGPEGVGKSLICQYIAGKFPNGCDAAYGEMPGSEFIEINTQSLVDRTRGVGLLELSDCQFTRGNIEKMKSLISTSVDRIRLAHQGKDSSGFGKRYPRRFALVATSNPTNVLPAGEQNRRFAVVRVDKTDAMNADAVKSFMRLHHSFFEAQAVRDWRAGASAQPDRALIDLLVKSNADFQDRDEELDDAVTTAASLLRADNPGLIDSPIYTSQRALYTWCQKAELVPASRSYQRDKTMWRAAMLKGAWSEAGRGRYFDVCRQTETNSHRWVNNG